MYPRYESTYIQQKKEEYKNRGLKKIISACLFELEKRTWSLHGMPRDKMCTQQHSSRLEIITIGATQSAFFKIVALIWMTVTSNFHK